MIKKIIVGLFAGIFSIPVVIFSCLFMIICTPIGIVDYIRKQIKKEKRSKK